MYREDFLPPQKVNKDCTQRGDCQDTALKMGGVSTKRIKLKKKAQEGVEGK